MGGPISLRYRPLRSYPLQNIQHEVQTWCSDIRTNESCFSGLEGWCYILRVSPLPVCRKSIYFWSLASEGWWHWRIFQTSLLSTYATPSFFLRLASWWLVSLQLARVCEVSNYLTLQLMICLLSPAPVKRLLNHIRKLVHVIFLHSTSLSNACHIAV